MSTYVSCNFDDELSKKLDSIFHDVDAWNEWATSYIAPDENSYEIIALRRTIRINFRQKNCPIFAELQGNIFPVYTEIYVGLYSSEICIDLANTKFHKGLGIFAFDVRKEYEQAEDKIGAIYLSAADIKGFLYIKGLKANILNLDSVKVSNNLSIYEIEVDELILDNSSIKNFSLSGFEIDKFSCTSAMLYGEFVLKIKDIFKNIVKAKFRNHVNFSKSIFKSSLSIEGCIFENEANFRGISVEGMASFKGTTFAQVPDFKGAHFVRSPPLDEIVITKKKPEKEDEEKYHALERLAYKDYNRKMQEEFFIKTMECKPFLFQHEYKSYSNYGRSVLRPLSYLGLIILAAFVLHFAHAYHLSWEAVFHSAILALEQSVLPLKLMHAPAVAQAREAIYGDAALPFVTLYEFFHGLFATVLLFLIGLGLRNTFRLK